jgi:hypothetical protein
MKYTVHLEGFEDQHIEVEPPGFFSSSQMYVNGNTVVSMENGEYLLKRSDGPDVLVKVKQSFFYDAPSLQINGKTIHIIEPLAWYQYLLSSVPLVFLMWGFFGALIGIGLITMNVRIFHSKLSKPLQYLSVCAISFVVPVMFFLFRFAVAKWNI